LAYCAYCGSHVAQVSFVPCASCGEPTNGAPRRVVPGGTNVGMLVIVIVVVALVFVAILGILAAIAIPNFLTAIERSKQKRTMADMRSVAFALEAYGTDHEQEQYPPGTTVAALREHLQPAYIKTVPTVDGWGHELRYMPMANRGYAIASAAKDGRFEQDSLDQYSSRTTSNFDCDIVFTNGEFVQYPEYSSGGGR
jgi:type II secretory pathway pseudopilin PulG